MIRVWASVDPTSESEVRTRIRAALSAGKVKVAAPMRVAAASETWYTIAEFDLIGAGLGLFVGMSEVGGVVVAEVFGGRLLIASVMGMRGTSPEAPAQPQPSTLVRLKPRICFARYS